MTSLYNPMVITLTQALKDSSSISPYPPEERFDLAFPTSQVSGLTTGVLRYRNLSVSLVEAVPL